jgi:hypothetical protein
LNAANACVSPSAFGNLIALPLQHMPRGHGNSVFLNANFDPHPDQWTLLSSLRRMAFSEVENVVREAERSGDLIGVRRSVTDDEQTEDPWILPPSRKKKDEPITGPLPAKVRVVRGNLIFVEKEGLPSAMLNRLHRLAAFQNPEFYRAQAMRLSTFGKPRVIRCAEEFPKHVALPRGCLGEITALLESHKITTELDDQCFAGQPIDVMFHGQLRPDQQAAASAMLAFDDGILSATTAFGKTVVAAWLIAARKVNTLVLVHRRQLLDQWRERLAAFLNLPIKSIGQIGGGRRRSAGLVDVAVIQSLNRKQVVDDVVANYGHVIVDECHHISAVSFEQVLRQVKARYVTGLTATLLRKDGHHPIIIMQCGPIRHRVDAKEQALARPFKHFVIPWPTNFRLPPSTEKQEMHELILDPLVNINQRITDLSATVNHLPAQGHEINLLMHLKKSIVSQQVVQVRDGIAVAPCAGKVPLQFHEFDFIVRTGAVIIIHGGFDFFQMSLDAALAGAKQTTDATEQHVSFRRI